MELDDDVSSVLPFILENFLQSDMQIVIVILALMLSNVIVPYKSPCDMGALNSIDYISITSFLSLN